MIQRISHRRCSIKKLYLNILQYSPAKVCIGVLLLRKLQARRKNETPTQMCSSEYCKIFKSTYFEESLRTAASENKNVNAPAIYIYTAA